MNVKDLKKELEKYPEETKIAIVNLDSNFEQAEILDADSFDLVDAKSSDETNVKLLCITIGGETESN